MSYIGIDVGGTNLVAGLVDEEGHILHKASCPVDKGMDDRALCGQLVRLAREACAGGGADPAAIESVGVGIPGLVDNARGLVIQTANMPFCSTPLGELFRREWDVPVFLGNDANCAAIGEYWAGAAKGCDPAVVVTLGTGIGGGLVAGGRVFTGFANAGMEVGHMIIRPGGLLCGCGNRGCWEQYGSATALIRITKEHMARHPDSALWEICGGDLSRVEGRTPFEGARRGDAAAKEALDEYLDGLATGIINLINILQPEIICLGGGVSNAADDLLLDPLRELAYRGSYDKHTRVRLEHAALGNDAGVVGAALLCRVV